MTRLNKCVMCLRPEYETGFQLDIGPNRNHTICNDCSVKVEEAQVDQ